MLKRRLGDALKTLFIAKALFLEKPKRFMICNRGITNIFARMSSLVAMSARNQKRGLNNEIDVFCMFMQL